MGSPEMMMKNFILTLLMSSIATKHFLVQTEGKAGVDYSKQEPKGPKYIPLIPVNFMNMNIVDFARKELGCEKGDVKVSNFKAQVVAGTNYEFVLNCRKYCPNCTKDGNFWQTLTCKVKVYEDLLGKIEMNEPASCAG